MNVTLTLAWRNLWRHKRRTWLTVAAMVFCNVLLIFMISIQLSTYSLMIDNSLNLFSGHAQVQHRDYLDEPRMRRSIPAATELRDRLATELQVPVGIRATGFALVSSEERSMGVPITGVDSAIEESISRVPSLVKQGRYLQAGDEASMVIGAALARNLKIDIGDEVSLLGSGRDGSFAAGFAQIVGIIDSGIPDIDRGMAQMPLAYFQELFFMGDHAHQLVISAPNTDAVPPLVNAARELLADRDTLRVHDWDALMPGLRQAIQSDLASNGFVYAVLTILVAFSVLNTQLMSVLERTREFGVLTALGVSPGRLARLVFYETGMMACIGFAFGVLFGAILVFWLSQQGLAIPGMEEMSRRFNLPPRIFPELSVLTLTIGPTVVFSFCLIAAIYPAFKLWRIQPIEAMRAV